MRDTRGITLIALIITIIVLVILAGITLQLLIGENGIIDRARQAGKEYDQVAINEQRDLNELYSSILIATNDNAQITISVEELKSFLQKEANTAVAKALTTEDITSSLHLNSEYVSPRGGVNMSKSGNTIVLTAYLNVLKEIPANTTILTVDELYNPKITSVHEYYTSSRGVLR